MANVRLRTRVLRSALLCGLVFLVALYGLIGFRVQLARQSSPEPQAILTLGGGVDREQFTAQFAIAHPELPIWISSGTPPCIVQPIFQQFGVPLARLNLDYRAVDTLTNFTTLIPIFRQRRIRHLYLITSSYHMTRAKAVATLVLGSQGIAFQPVPMPAGPPREGWWPTLRDLGRSLLWLLTGRTGSSLKVWLDRLTLIIFCPVSP